jgi:4-hydroxybenzoate polyprenyltransferase
MKPGPASRPVKYWRLLRIKISLAYFFPMAFGFSIAADANPCIPWYGALFAFLAFFCGSLFASTLNFYVDVEADRDFNSRFKDMDLARQPFVAGEMGSRETTLVFLLSAAGCVTFSLLAGWRTAVFLVGFVVVVGFLYSHPRLRLKARPVTDMLCNVAGMGLTLYAGLSLGYIGAGGNAQHPGGPPVLFLVWGALFITVVYVPTVANDVPFDRAAGYRTSGVVFGAQNLIYSLVPMVLAMAPLAVLLVLSGGVVWQYKFMAGLGTVLAFGGVTFVLLRWRPPHIRMDPDLVLVPMDLFLLFFVAYGLYRIVES